ncbi:Protein of unknown function (DUF3352) [Rivularia sp. PCC 7116]|uniref:DUF3352 domain-containing protein n=1 Tax=Rivularia sp. PCC 7116 TaxID=373994 RepID=UPI00029EF10E|nr:DUF3352 domain-containing protein [Rivularia sp. PCC 7116]AFY56745.1 Protein of unknown function (DUF3352) [Rivularia sp. PCC 7116]
MKSLVRVGAIATLNLLCCSSFAQAVDVTNNIELQSNLSQKKIFKNRLAQNEIPASLKNRLQSTATNTKFASFLPKDAPLVAMVDTSSETWRKAGKFQLFQSVWNGISFLIPPQVKQGYATDIEPWLGEQVAFAFLPKMGSAQITVQSNFVTLVPVKDEAGLENFLDKLKAGGGLNQRQYKGITILETKTGNSANPSFPEKDNTIPSVPKSPINKAVKVKPNIFQKPTLKPQRSLAIAILPKHIAIGYSNKAIERVINTSRQKAATLAQNSQFQKTIRQSPAGKPLFAMYQDPIGYLNFAKEIIKDPSLGLPNFNLDDILSSRQLKQYKSIGSFVTVQKEGIRFQLNTYPAPEFQTNKLANNIQTQTILSRMPAATYSAVNGNNLNQRWQAIAKLLSSQKELKNGLTTLRGLIRSNTGLDLDRDIISWMDGEFAFFMYPTKGGFFQAVDPNLKMGIGLAVQTSNRSAAEATLNKLENLITSVSKGEAEVVQKNIKNQAVTSWEFEGDSAKSLLAYSWVDDNTLILTTGYGAIADLVPQPYVALDKTYNFNTATNSFPSPNAGYFYMNMGSLLSWIYNFVPQEYSNNLYFNMFKQAIGSVYSVSATTSSHVDRQQADFLIVLAPVRKKIK